MEINTCSRNFRIRIPICNAVLLIKITNCRLVDLKQTVCAILLNRKKCNITYVYITCGSIDDKLL